MRTVDNLDAVAWRNARRVDERVGLVLSIKARRCVARIAVDCPGVRDDTLTIGQRCPGTTRGPLSSARAARATERDSSDHRKCPREGRSK
jgi:hypothetical protein